MAAQLYFEDEAGTFARLNVSNVSTAQTLAYEHDSWTTQLDEETGEYLESMILWISAPTTSVRRSLINRLQNLLNEANSPVNTCRVVEQTQDEGLRTATVLSGRLEPVPDRVLHRDLTGDANRWALVFRRTPWEVSLETETWHEVPNYPGTTAATLPDSVTSGNMMARIDTLSIAPNQQAYGRKFWYGVKAARHNIDGFMPFIRVGRSAPDDPHVWLQNDCTFADGDADVASPINAIGSYCVYTQFSQYTQLIERFTAPLRYWNTHTATIANRHKYVGEYLLIARMMVQAGTPEDVDTSTVIAVQARTALGGRGVGSTQEPVYVGFRQNVWQMVNLGRIRVGASTWNRNIMNLEGLGNYRVEILAQLVDGTAGLSRVYFDNMFLMPAEHYVYVETGASNQYISNDDRLDVVTTERGDVAAFAASRTFVGGQGVESGTFPVYAQFSVELPTVERSDNWGVPFYRGSKFVYVMEDLQGSSTSGTSHITMLAAPRTHEYAVGT